MKLDMDNLDWTDTRPYVCVLCVFLCVCPCNQRQRLGCANLKDSQTSEASFVMYIWLFWQLVNWQRSVRTLIETGEDA